MASIPTTTIITAAYIIMISLVGPANLDIVCLILPYTSLPSKQQQQLLVWNKKLPGHLGKLSSPSYIMMEEY